LRRIETTAATNRSGTPTISRCGRGDSDTVLNIIGSCSAVAVGRSRILLGLFCVQLTFLCPVGFMRSTTAWRSSAPNLGRCFPVGTAPWSLLPGGLGFCRVVREFGSNPLFWLPMRVSRPPRVVACCLQTAHTRISTIRACGDTFAPARRGRSALGWFGRSDQSVLDSV
jgi:hypothetical protein